MSRYFEDFQVGDVYRTPYGRTVTEMDNALFTHLTMNTNPLHFDERYAEQSRWGRILVNSTLTLSLVVGMTVAQVSENAMANLGWEQIKLTHPVFIGDTLYAQTQVINKRASRSHPDAGIVTIHTRGLNGEGEGVIEFTRAMLIYKRDAAPSQDLFPMPREA